ncbi:manganese containing catalase [Desulforamulus ruminis DSM 2154]|uniref:Manganese containing catalase n=1 Tax=Desulforamulus ruminis (strain ATCC 23193 / DSM 2154 / NCIMB 8452 / DL) TaxID=696281 RepID=F6DTZ0_DESRL|nr:manganese containing catalase [Desulforamulus ruminis DSM 2154]
MWIYEKKLEIPVRVSGPDPRMAKYVITQYGGPDLFFCRRGRQSNSISTISPFLSM